MLKIKKILKNRIFLVIITMVLSVGTTVCATVLYEANQVSYTPEDSNWDVSTVDAALNDLYDKKNMPSGYVFLGNAVWDNGGSGSNEITYTCTADGILVASSYDNNGKGITINGVKPTALDTKGGVNEFENVKIHNTSRAGEWDTFYKVAVKEGDVVKVFVPLGGGWTWYNTTATIIYGVTE